jgi:hypothetical protein
MNAIILKGAALRQPPLPQSGPRAKTIAHPCCMVYLLPVHLPAACTGIPHSIFGDACGPELQLQPDTHVLAIATKRLATERGTVNSPALPTWAMT